MDLKIGKTGIEEAQWEFSFSESTGSFPILKAVAWGQRETFKKYPNVFSYQ